jgi:phage-related minor tail protein
MSSLIRKNVAEAIGVLSIVASLIFVGIQIQQAQNIAVAEGLGTVWSTQIERFLDILNRRGPKTDVGQYPYW